MSVARYFNPRMRAKLLRGEKLPWNLDKHPRNAYIVQCILSSVPWGNPQAIRAKRKLAAELTRTTGIRHVLDHEIPLNHPLVCGLTCDANLRVVTYAVNAAKGGKWYRDQGELFDDADRDHGTGAVQYLSVAPCDAGELQGVQARALPGAAHAAAERGTGPLRQVA